MPFSVKSGKETWFKKVDDRSCTSCHSESVLLKGSHIRTGKVIEPMAPSVNPERLTNIKKMKKLHTNEVKKASKEKRKRNGKATGGFTTETEVPKKAE